MNVEDIVSSSQSMWRCMYHHIILWQDCGNNKRWWTNKDSCAPNKIIYQVNMVSTYNYLFTFLPCVTGVLFSSSNQALHTYSTTCLATIISKETLGEYRIVRTQKSLCTVILNDVIGRNRRTKNWAKRILKWKYLISYPQSQRTLQS